MLTKAVRDLMSTQQGALAIVSPDDWCVRLRNDRALTIF